MKTLQQQKSKLESDLQNLKADVSSRDQQQKTQRDQLEAYVLRCIN